MKKIIAFALVTALLFSFASCKKSDNTDETEKNVSETTEPEKELVTESSLGIDREQQVNAAIVYFSHNDGIKEAAEAMAEHTGYKLIEITPETPYPEDEALLEQRRKTEAEEGQRPVLVYGDESVYDCDIVILGFPVWENTMPMAVWTFIEDHDMYGKAVIPFCAPGENGFGSALYDLTAICRLDVLTDGFTIGGEDEAPEKLLSWLDGVLYGE